MGIRKGSHEIYPPNIINLVDLNGILRQFVSARHIPHSLKFITGLHMLINVLEQCKPKESRAKDFTSYIIGTVEATCWPFMAVFDNFPSLGLHHTPSDDFISTYLVQMRALPYVILQIREELLHLLMSEPFWNNFSCQVICNVGEPRRIFFIHDLDNIKMYYGKRIINVPLAFPEDLFVRIFQTG